MQTFFLFFVLQRYPDYIRMSLWCGLVVNFLSLFASSFATKVRRHHFKMIFSIC